MFPPHSRPSPCVPKTFRTRLSQGLHFLCFFVKKSGFFGNHLGEMWGFDVFFFEMMEKQGEEARRQSVMFGVHWVQQHAP